MATLTASDYRPDRILVQFQPGTTPNAAAGTTLSAPLSLVPGLYEVTLDPQTAVATALNEYQSSPSVAYAQPDYWVAAERIPNDPGFKSQWAYTNPFNPAATIKATTAWDTTVGSSQVTVAVIDTGIDFNHPDLAANLWHNPGEVPGNGKDDDGNGYVDDYYGYNFVKNTGSPMDDNGHGTHVAGIIGAVGNNGIGVTGLAWNVKIMALKFMNSTGKGSTSDALRALNYAVQMGATISNNSWTSPAADSALEAGIRNAQSAGQIYVAAAGNNGKNNDLYKVYPASFTPDNIVAVAALDSTNRLASWSNWGPNTVAIAAPGSGVYSTLPGNRYGTMSGTSMATPFVTATLALVRELHPDWSYRQVIDRVLSTADPLPTLAGKVKAGKLNVAAAVGPVGPPPPPPGPDLAGAKVTGLASLISNNQITGLRVTFSEPIQANTFAPSDILSLAGPGGTIIPTSVTPVAGNTTQFDVVFPGKSQTGTYSVVLGADIRDLAGNMLNQNGNGANGESPGDRYTGTVVYTSTNQYEAPAMPAPLVDRGIATYTLPVSDSMTVGAVRVQINLSHAWMSDLVIKLRSPAGTEVLLANRRGFAGKGYVNTVFDDKAALALAQGTPTFTGAFRPEAFLAAFKGQRTDGTWTLVIEDKAGGATGTIYGWSLTFDQAAGGASVNEGSPHSSLARELVRSLAAKPGLTPIDDPSARLTPPPMPQTPQARAPGLTWQQYHSVTVVRRQTQQLLTAWQSSVTARPLATGLFKSLGNQITFSTFS